MARKEKWLCGKRRGTDLWWSVVALALVTWEVGVEGLSPILSPLDSL